MNDITIVTCFFDIGRGSWNKTSSGNDVPHYIPRSNETYMNYFKFLSKMKNDMIIYCDPNNVEIISHIRKKNSPSSITHIIPVDFNKTVSGIKPTIEKIQSRKEYINLIDDPRMPEYWNADYVLVNYLKTDFVNDAYNRNIINTPLAAWLDFGYIRDESGLPNSLTWKYDFNPNKMHYFNKIDIDHDRPIFDIIKTNTVYIMGCHIVGGKNSWAKHKQLNDNSFNCLIKCGLIDDDQTILLMNYLHSPDLYEIHKIDVLEEEWNNWNVIFKKFNNF